MSNVYRGGGRSCHRVFGRAAAAVAVAFVAAAPVVLRGEEPAAAVEEAAPAGAEAASGPTAGGADRPEPVAEPAEGVAGDGVETVGAIIVAAPPVVDGTRADRNGVQVTSVSEEQVESLNAQDLTGALRRVPGVVVSRYNVVGSFGGGDGGSIFVRGHGSGRPGAEISTRIDGVPRFVGVWTHPILDTLNVDIAERVAVYRSAQAVTLGNMSFAAVDVTPKRISEEGVHARGIAQYGSHDSMVFRAEQGAKVSAFDYFLNLSYRASDGHRENADGNVNDIFGRAGYELTENWYVSFLFDHTDADVGDPLAEGAAPHPRPDRFITDNELYILSLSHSYESLEGYVKLSFEDGYIDWKQWDFTVPEPFDSETEYENCGVRARETWRPWEGGELTGGYDYESIGGDFAERRPSGDRNVSSGRFYNTGPYLLASQAFDVLDDRLEITPSAGVRYNQSRYFDGDWGAHAGLRLSHEDTVVHANYARAYNLPGVWVVTQYLAFGRGDQWKDLDAELLDHFELGLSQGVTEWLDVGVTGFYDDVRNGLRFVPPPPPPPLFANVGDYQLAGGEATVDVVPLDTLRLFAGSAYTHTTPDDVPNAPRWTVSFGASWIPIRNVTLSVDGQWIDERYVLNPRFAAAQALVDDYFLLNSRVAWQVHPHVQVFAGGENLTDSDYELRPGYPMPGITGYVGMEAKL